MRGGEGRGGEGRGGEGRGGEGRGGEGRGGAVLQTGGLSVSSVGELFPLGTEHKIRVFVQPKTSQYIICRHNISAILNT